jgi:hypothetical protein
MRTIKRKRWILCSAVRAALTDAPAKPGLPVPESPWLSAVALDFLVTVVGRDKIPADGSQIKRGFAPPGAE